MITVRKIIEESGESAYQNWEEGAYQLENFRSFEDIKNFINKNKWMLIPENKTQYIWYRRPWLFLIYSCLFFYGLIPLYYFIDGINPFTIQLVGDYIIMTIFFLPLILFSVWIIYINKYRIKPGFIFINSEGIHYKLYYQKSLIYSMRNNSVLFIRWRDIVDIKLKQHIYPSNSTRDAKMYWSGKKNQNLLREEDKDVWIYDTNKKTVNFRYKNYYQDQFLEYQLFFELFRRYWNRIKSEESRIYQ